MMKSLDNEENYWVHDLEVKYFHEHESMLFDLGFKSIKSEDLDNGSKICPKGVTGYRVLDFSRREKTTKLHYTVIESVKNCPPPNMENWL